MAKKYKRSVSVQSRTAPTNEAPAEQKPTSMFARRSTTTEFAPDYTYIRNDLKRIGIMSGTFFVILVVVSIILPLIQR